MIKKLTQLSLIGYYFFRTMGFYIPALIKAKWAAYRGDMIRSKTIFYRDLCHKLFAMLAINLKYNSQALPDNASERPVMYVSNHPSMLDIPSLMQIVNLDTHMVYHPKVADFPFPGFRWMLTQFEHLPISSRHDARFIYDREQIRQRMKTGGYYWVAPEGGLSSQRLMPFKKTFFYLAKETDAIVVPICIQGSGQVIAQADSWLTLKINRGRTIECHVLPELDACDFETATDLCQASHDAIADCLTKQCHINQDDD